MTRFVDTIAFQITPPRASQSGSVKFNLLFAILRLILQFLSGTLQSPLKVDIFYDEYRDYYIIPATMGW